MSEKEKQSKEFKFNKSLKEDTLYPYLKYLPVDRYIFRPLASLVVRAVYKTPITPNQLTYFSFFLGVLSGVLFCFGEPLYFLIAGITAQFSTVFDCADGMLARSQDKCSHFGAYLDIFLDRFIDFFVFIGIIIGHFVHSGNFEFFIAGIFTVTLIFLEMSLYYITKNYKKRDKPGECAAAKGLIFFILFIFSLVNRLDLFIIALMIGVPVNITYKVITFLDPDQKI